MKYKLFFLILLVLLCGCGKNIDLQTKPFEIQTLLIYPADQMMPINSTLQFHAIAISQDGSSQKVDARWQVDNSYYNFGTFEANGLFRSSNKSGATTISACYGAYCTTTMIGITPGTLTSLQITPESATLIVGDYYTFQFIAKDSYGNVVNVTPTWSVEGGIGEIYGYSGYANFHAAAAGTGRIKMTSGSLEASAAVTVINITPYTYVTKWSTKINGESAYCRGVVVGPDGNVWAAMYRYFSPSYEGWVSKYDTSGNFILSLEATVTGEGTFQIPNDLAFDQSGNIYVVDLNANRVRKYGSGGNYLLAWGGLGSGHGEFNGLARIVVDKNNNVYVSDCYNDLIQKFDSSGNFLLQWGGEGSDPGQLHNPSGIAVDSSGYIYVADQGNGRIQKFDSSGNYISSFGSQGTGVYQFDHITGIAIDKEDKLFITDYYMDRIYKYDTQGNFLTRWGSGGYGDGQLDGLIDVAVDDAGNVYAADSRNYRVQKFRP